MRSKEFPRAQPEGTPETLGLPVPANTINSKGKYCQSYKPVHHFYKLDNGWARRVS